jgi:hypothetical protein
MDSAEVRFIKTGTNRDAAVCVYQWAAGDAPMVLETVVDP